jgi:hypothetical protein
VPHPNNERKYILCNAGPNSARKQIKKCSEGLVFDKENLTCEYTAIVEFSELLEHTKRRLDTIG